MLVGSKARFLGDNHAQASTPQPVLFCPHGRRPLANLAATAPLEHASLLLLTYRVDPAEARCLQPHPRLFCYQVPTLGNGPSQR